MCFLLENVGGSEQNQSVANVQSDDLWPSRMHAATHIHQEKTHACGVLKNNLISNALSVCSDAVTQAKYVLELGILTAASRRRLTCRDLCPTVWQHCARYAAFHVLSAGQEGAAECSPSILITRFIFIFAADF